MNKSLRRTIIVFRISSIVYIILSSIFFYLALFDPFHLVNSIALQLPFIVVGIVGYAIAIFVEVVVLNLKKGKFWAWVTGIIISGLYIPSLFIVLGVIALIGLLDKETKAQFLRHDD